MTQAPEDAPEADFDDIEITDLQIETLSGDLRDALLMRVRDMKRPWSALTEEEQRDLANGLDMTSRDLIRRSVRLLTAWDWPRAVVTLGEIKIVGGDKARIEGKIVAPNIEEYRNILGDHVMSQVMLVAVDSDAFMGERAPAQIDPDQPELPGGDEDQPAEGEPADNLVAKARTIILSEGNASTSLIQRRLAIGFNRAAQIMTKLEDMGVVSPPDVNGKRSILRPGQDGSGEAAA